MIRRISFSLFIFSFLITSSLDAQPGKNTAFAENSVLSSGQWYKFSLDKTGIYRITYNDLVQWGINPAGINPKNIKLYGNGGRMLPEANSKSFCDDLNENAIWISGEEDNVFDQEDYILFYGQSPVVWNYDTLNVFFSHSMNYYSDVSCYFLTIGTSPGKRISDQETQGTPNHIVSNFTDYTYHEKDSLNLLRSGKDWFGEYFDFVKTMPFKYNFQNLTTGSKVKVKINIAARNTIPSEFDLTGDNLTHSLIVSAIPGQYTSDYARTAEEIFSYDQPQDSINFFITLNTQGSVGWLNFFDLNCERNLVFYGNQMSFRNTECIGSGNITRFSLDNGFVGKRIWNVSNPFNIKEKTISFFQSTPSITEYTDSLQEFIAFDESGLMKPHFISKIANQNLHALQPEKLIIITSPDFITQANRLASLHSQYDQISSIIVEPEKIYNEFSSGIQDISAIRNFVRMLYNKAETESSKPKYLLLIGDASYDYKNRLIENTNVIPTFESNNSLMPTSSYLSDDFFGLMDSIEGENCYGNLDIGIGRFPCVSVSEVKAIVDKIEIYLKKENVYSELNGCTTYTDSIHGDWRNTICFIGDDEDNNLHISQANELATTVDSLFQNINVNKIFLDAYQQVTGPSGQSYPDVNNMLNRQIKQGALFINYTGHGGEDSWAGENILQLSDIYSWKNLLNLPAFVTATCEFSRFDDPTKRSAGELILTKADGGGIGLFTTTRLAFSNSNFSLNKSFYKFALTKDSTGSYNRMGDIIRLSKVDNNSIVNVRNFVLLGDPALRLSYPEENVITTTINGQSAFGTPDTVRAGDIVTVSGIIADDNGNKLQNFNGLLLPTVFDRKTLNTTLANDPQSIPYNFYTQNNILFKGKVSVINGDFTFSFVLPNNLYPGIGKFRISYYAEDGTTNATGYYEDPSLIVNGIDSCSVYDNSGPQIEPYLNNTQFVSGGSADANPLLLIYLNDSNGINSFGLGLGHEITAVLDNKSSSEIVLNDYFEPDFNNYQSGWVNYPLTNLSFGDHELQLKAWDLMDNSSEAKIVFTVTAPNGISISKMLVYPNPFSDKTYFYFEHNQPCCDMQVNIDICDLNGKKVNTINESIMSGSIGITPIEWNGTSENGSTLANGIYFFRLKSTSSDGSYIERAGKIVISK
jgi:hypothetical protein